MIVLLLIGAGLLPLLTGYLMNAGMMANPERLLPYTLIALLFLLVWSLIGFAAARKGLRLKPALLAAHALAILALGLILIQELIVGHYWTSFLGVASQFYFLPVLNLGSKLVFWGGRVWQASLVSIALLPTAFCLGHRAGQRK